MIQIPNMKEQLILNSIRQVCEENPHLLPQIIEYATKGVKEFAEKQSDKTSKMAFIMTQLLDEMPDKTKFGPFSRAEILESMTSLHGTAWHNKELKKLS